jgi:hypothetical protein
VLAPVPHRHVVVTIPRLLRPTLRRRRELLRDFAQCASDALGAYGQFEVALLVFRTQIAATQYLGQRRHSTGRRSILKNLADGPQTVPAMAQRRAVSRQHIQKLVDTLKADGLVTSASPCPSTSARVPKSYVSVDHEGRELETHGAGAAIHSFAGLRQA